MKLTESRSTTSTSLPCWDRSVSLCNKIRIEKQTSVLKEGKRERKRAGKEERKKNRVPASTNLKGDVRLNRTDVLTWKHVYNWAGGVDNDNNRLRGDYGEEISDQE